MSARASLRIFILLHPREGALLFKQSKEGAILTSNLTVLQTVLTPPPRPPPPDRNLLVPDVQLGIHLGHVDEAARVVVEDRAKPLLHEGGLDHLSQLGEPSPHDDRAVAVAVVSEDPPGC